MKEVDYSALPLLALLVLGGCGGPDRVDSAYAPSDLTAWSHYLGDPGRTHFSTLSQIDSTNVAQLEVAWTYAAGGLTEGAITEIQHNPLVVGPVLYGRSPDMDVFALKADTGELLWNLELQPAGPGYFGKARGLMRWVSEDGRTERIYAGAGFHLYAIDPALGTLDAAFGGDGRIDLRAGLGKDPESILVGMNTPGAVFENLLIVGGRVDEWPGAAPGHIRAYDARTGAQVWTFHTIPQPGEFGYDTWPDGGHEIAGAANSWAGMSVDLDRGIVFVPTGSASWDYYGADRPGNNLFANTLLALDARTGERIWHQQIVRHDLWDRDLPAPPNLVMVERNGVLVPAVAQITKDAHVWVFHRETGEPLFPVREVVAPLSSLIGEWTAPTQRLPELPAPFARQQVTREELYRPEVGIQVERLGPAEGERPGQTVGEFFQTLSSRGQFDPPSREGTVIFPGLDGGGEWGGAAVDPRTGLMYVNGSEMAWIAAFEPVDPEARAAETLFGLYCMRCHAGATSVGPDLTGVSEMLSADSITSIIKSGRNAMPANPQLTEAQVNEIVAWLSGLESDSRDAQPATRYPYRLYRWGRLLDEFSKPIIRPPWGLLTAIDLNSGEHVWQIPLGNDEDISDPDYPVTGIENYGGPVVTAGGLIFIAATKDEKFRAFNAGTGELLWETQLPAGGYATPATFEVSGRQYVVIAAGGGKMGTPSGDQYLAFALPEN